MSHKPLLCTHSWIRNTFIFPTRFGPLSQHQGYHLLPQEGHQDNYIFHYNQICVDKSSLNFCLTFPKSDLEIKYHMKHTYIYILLSVTHLYWHMIASHRVNTLRNRKIGLTYIKYTICHSDCMLPLQAKARLVYTIPNNFSDFLQFTQIAENLTKISLIIKLTCTNAFEKMPVVLLLTLKVLHRCSAFWWLLAEQTNLLDNILCIEIVEHVKLLLRNWW